MAYVRKNKQGKMIASTLYVPVSTDKAYRNHAKKNGKSKSKAMTETLITHKP